MVAIGVVSGLMQIFSPIPTSIILGSAIGLLVLSGWLFGAFTHYTRRNLKSAAERAIEAIMTIAPMPYLDSWLRSTLLSEHNISDYMLADTQVHIDEFEYTSRLTGNDATLTLKLSGWNTSTEPASRVPMIMFGGSVIRYDSFPVNKALLMSDNGTAIPLRQRLVRDRGTFQMVDIMLPSPIQLGEKFEIIQEHSWPFGMTDREDTVWFPYPLIFEKGISKLSIRIVSDWPIVHARGMRLSMRDLHCGSSRFQPETADSRTQLVWNLPATEPDELLWLVIDREIPE
ncbi:MAG: hypothetical protein CME34_02595 [Gordonia sp.]|uniref:hypothetical protein n=1 Tax=Gordonia sp. (in: high G+C Gram-positive bacteria) TaxID=84139 RepID=UPI000C4E816F|nr:hypothetical protein [Gordonia sp. (in: high G+C Gram-positive bacteria)]MAU80763.1 hypothetical protein [Gordonia sp. (in: high G+C Gram-positive bacteria)]